MHWDPNSAGHPIDRVSTLSGPQGHLHTLWSVPPLQVQCAWSSEECAAYRTHSTQSCFKATPASLSTMTSPSTRSPCLQSLVTRVSRVGRSGGL